MLWLVTSALLASSPTTDVAAPRPHLGIQLDVGFPGGASAAVAFYPLRWLRFELGGAHNLAATGVRGGLTLSPLSTAVRPTLSLHAGHFPRGDLRPIGRAVGAGDPLDSSLLSSVQYDFFTAQLGMEIGSPTGVSGFVRAGIGRATARFPATEDALREASGDPSVTARPLVLSLFVPSIQVGISTLFL